MAAKRIKADLIYPTPDIKDRLCRAIGLLDETVPYDIDIKPRRLTRSNKANAYWHAVPVEMFRIRLYDSGQRFTHEQCHEWLRNKFLAPVPTFCPKTGEELEPMPPSSRVLDGVEFFEFVEHVRDWMRDSVGVVVPDPCKYGLRPTAKVEAGSQPSRRLTGHTAPPVAGASRNKPIRQLEHHHA